MFYILLMAHSAICGHFYLTTSQASIMTHLKVW